MLARLHGLDGSFQLGLPLSLILRPLCPKAQSVQVMYDTFSPVFFTPTPALWSSHLQVCKRIPNHHCLCIQDAQTTSVDYASQHLRQILLLELTNYEYGICSSLSCHKSELHIIDLDNPPHPGFHHPL